MVPTHLVRGLLGSQVPAVPGAGWGAHPCCCQRAAGPCAVGQSQRTHQAPRQTPRLLWESGCTHSSPGGLPRTHPPKSRLRAPPPLRTQTTRLFSLSLAHTHTWAPSLHPPSTCGAIGAGLGRRPPPGVREGRGRGPGVRSRGSANWGPTWVRKEACEGLAASPASRLGLCLLWTCGCSQTKSPPSSPTSRPTFPPKDG